MDAAEGDAEGKLYKASADLIPELRNKLPKLITYYGKSLPRLRRNVLDQKCHELTQLVGTKPIFFRMFKLTHFSSIGFKNGRNC